MRAKNYILTGITFIASFLLIVAFKSMPAELQVVKPFSTTKYLGKWYEMARLDYKYEKNLDNVTATYSLKENGMIEVDNKGYNVKKDKWEESIGKAKSAGDSTEAKLKVSFFGPFYASYNVIAIDKDYKYALVAGKNTDYLWILSREKTIPETIKTNYLQLAENAGYQTSRLVWVKHDKD